MSRETEKNWQKMFWNVFLGPLNISKHFQLFQILKDAGAEGAGGQTSEYSVADLLTPVLVSVPGEHRTGLQH